LDRSRLRELADAIEGLPHFVEPHENPYSDLQVEELEGFNMVNWLERKECGTAGCIAGWAAHLWGDEDDPTTSIAENAQYILRICRMESAYLVNPASYLPEISRQQMHHITPAEAARCLRLVADGVSAAEAWRRVLGGKDGYKLPKVR